MKLEKIKLFDFEGKETTFALKKQKIKAIILLLLTGDEVAFVVYEDGSCDKLDSSNTRYESTLDGEYIINNKETLKRFLERKNKWDLGW